MAGAVCKLPLAARAARRARTRSCAAARPAALYNLPLSASARPQASRCPAKIYREAQGPGRRSFRGARARPLAQQRWVRSAACSRPWGGWYGLDRRGSAAAARAAASANAARLALSPVVAPLCSAPPPHPCAPPQATSSAARASTAARWASSRAAVSAAPRGAAARTSAQLVSPPPPAIAPPAAQLACPRMLQHGIRSDAMRPHHCTAQAPSSAWRTRASTASTPACGEMTCWQLPAPTSRSAA